VLRGQVLVPPRKERVVRTKLTHKLPIALSTTALVVALAGTAGPAIAHGVNHALFAHNADKVDNKHAVGAGATLDARKGKLVATSPTTGYLPDNIIQKAGDAEKLDGVDSSGFLSATGKAADADKLDGLNSTAFATSTVEGWHEVGASGQPPFQNGWVNVGGVFSTAAFYKDPYGVVHLKGLIKSGTVGSPIFSLPEGYRPAAELNFAVLSNSALGILGIQPTCFFQLCTFHNVTLDAGSNPWVSLDGISFRADG
jgi:hypothetical protein